MRMHVRLHIYSMFVRMRSLFVPSEQKFALLCVSAYEHMYDTYACDLLRKHPLRVRRCACNVHVSDRSVYEMQYVCVDMSVSLCVIMYACVHHCVHVRAHTCYDAYA